MLVLMEEAYPWVAVFSPYRSVHGGIVPTAREADPNPGGGGAMPDGGVMGCLVGILPAVKVILHGSLPEMILHSMKEMPQIRSAIDE
jgi:hypothetical protein